MLSPGTYHERVPKQRAENLRFRLWLLRRAKADPAVRRALLHACTQDILFFINAFVLQFNPNADFGSEYGPFVCFPVQERAVHRILHRIEKRRDLLIEKSREMGASWLFLIIIKWLTDFVERTKFLLVSRSAEAVDKPEDSDSLMWKLDFVHDHLPSWLVPKARCSRRKMGYVNYRTRSAITGQASTGKAGVGGRCTAMFVDEWTQIEEDHEVYQRTSNTTRCRLFNFTHLGLATAAYKLVEAINSGVSNTEKLQMHWCQHPEKNRGLYAYDQEAKRVRFYLYNEDADRVDLVENNGFEYPPNYPFVTDGSPTGGPYPGLRSPWYDDEVLRKLDDRAVAADLDINPQGSLRQFFPPLLIHQLRLAHAEPAWWEGDVRYDPETGELIELAEREGGPLKLWLNLDGGRPPKSDYGAGCDIATGTGATPSCCSIADARIGQKVAEYADAHIDPKDFAALVVALCRIFADEDGNGCQLAWEHFGGAGTHFGRRVVDLGYRRFFYRVFEDKLGRARTEQPGWVPSGKNKEVLLMEYKADLKKRAFLNPSEKALEECLAFEYDSRGGVSHSGERNTDNPDAARENHGDRVIADALCAKMIRGQVVTPAEKPENAEGDVRSAAGRRRFRDEQRRLAESWS